MENPGLSMEDMFKARPARDGGGEKLARDALQHAVRDSTWPAAAAAAARIAGAGARRRSSNNARRGGGRAPAPAPAPKRRRHRSAPAPAPKAPAPDGDQLALNGVTAAVAAHLDADASLLERPMESGLFRRRTLLHLAASRGHPALVAELARGADRMRADPKGQTAAALARSKATTPSRRFSTASWCSRRRPLRRPRRHPRRARPVPAPAPRRAGAGARGGGGRRRRRRRARQVIRRGDRSGALSEGDADRFTDAIAGGDERGRLHRRVAPAARRGVGRRA